MYSTRKGKCYGLWHCKGTGGTGTSSKIIKKTAEIEVFHTTHVEYDIIKQFAAFVKILYFFIKNCYKRILFKENVTTWHL